MQTVEIAIHNKKYKISCDYDKKDHLLYLANNFNELVKSISCKTSGKGSDVLNFLLASLTLEDQVLELKNQLSALNQEYKQYKIEKNIEYKQMLNSINTIIADFENMKS